MTVTDELNAWIAEHGSCRDALNVALARLAPAQQALEAVEWICFDWEVCPWCQAESHEGHTSDCLRQRALTGEDK